MEKILIIYIILINLITFSVFGIDKLKAVKDKWRISEKVLFLLSIIGGSLGGLAGMYIFRHKTQKPAFKFGIPAIFIVQIVLVYFVMR